MKDYFGILGAKVKAVVKPAIWQFVPTIASQVKVAVGEGDKAKVLALADRLEATAREEREHADSVDALASHLKQSIADGAFDAVEAAEALALLQRSIDEAEDVITGHDEDDAPQN